MYGSPSEGVRVYPTESVVVARLSRKSNVSEALISVVPPSSGP